MKNPIESSYGRLNSEEGRINELEDRSFEIIWSNSRKKMFKNEVGYETSGISLSEPNKHYESHSNIKKKKKKTECLLGEMFAEYFPNLGRKIDFENHEAPKDPNRLSLKRSIPRHIIIKLSNVKYKEGISKAASEKWLFHSREQLYYCQLISQHKSCRPGEHGMTDAKY